MAVDNTIRFNSHNSYKVTSQVFCYPFGVQGQSYVTHSFQAYCTSMLSSATRAKTKFFASDGSLVSESSHAFAVTTVFGIVEITVAIPATAVQAQLMFIQGGTDWWFAEPKSEYGEDATPYTVNYTNQLTYITPTGIYTGMVTTGQIVVVGSVESPSETLETRLVTINSNAINLSASVSGLSSDVGDQETRLTTIEAGQITLTSTVNGIAPKVTKITSAGIYTGTISATQISTGYLSADRIAAGTITADKINVSNLFAQNVTATGTITSLKLTSPAITGGSLNIGSGKFTVDSSGNLTATSATITGTLQAGSVVNGSLNSTTGTHTGGTTGAHTGTVNSSSIAGTLASTGGRHDGRVYSAYGSLGGVDFTSSSGYLQFSGRVVGTSGLTSNGVLYATYTAGTYSIIASDWISCVGVYESSDERLKQDIVSADSSLAQSIYDLPLIEYAFKRHPDKRQIGVNANQVVKVMPRKFSDLVVGTNDGYFNVNYTGLNTMAILAIQDLNKRVRTLESA